MPRHKGFYVRLRPHELALLDAMAADERRERPEQAAHVICQAIRRWQSERDFEATMTPVLADEYIEGAA